MCNISNVEGVFVLLCIEVDVEMVQLWITSGENARVEQCENQCCPLVQVNIFVALGERDRYDLLEASIACLGRVQNQLTGVKDLVLNG